MDQPSLPDLRGPVGRQPVSAWGTLLAVSPVSAWGALLRVSAVSTSRTLGTLPAATGRTLGTLRT